MAEDKSIRVVVKVNPSRHPELFEALDDIDPSGRAERLRTLALMALSGYTAANDSPDPGSGKSKRTRAKATPSESSESEKPESTSKGPASASNDSEETGQQEVEAQPAQEEKEEEADPHADIRASVVSGLKHSGF
jgi:hypothetical protein